ncbi:MAG: hypothetical protein DDT26_02174 [Dehalococcoidia bacterium]|nr:hypothetical protein [Chloroflexota bacterium]
MTKFFDLFFDAEGVPDMWHLRYPIDESGDIMNANMLPDRGPYVGPRIAKVQIDTRYPGRPLDFSFGYFSFLMVKHWVADLIEAHGGKIQRYPVTLEPTGETGYEVIFTLDAPKGLIDLARAREYELYQEDDLQVEMPYGGVRPRQKGMLYKIYDLHIDPVKAQGWEFFRPWEYPILIVSDSLKTAFDNAGVTGIAYRAVS